MKPSETPTNVKNRQIAEDIKDASLLARSSNEIRRLRDDNLIMRAKLEMFDDCMRLAGKPIHNGLMSSNDIVSDIEDRLYAEVDESENHLVNIFKELKFGRPVEAQKYLDKCIAELEGKPKK